MLPEQITEFVHVDRPMYILKYLPNENRIYCVDKSRNIVSYKLLHSVLNYKTAVMRRDIATANKILKTQIPEAEYNTIAQFLSSQGFKKHALMVATDPDLKFELAIDIGLLDEAYKIVQSYDDYTTTEVQHKWKQVCVDVCVCNRLWM